MKNFYSLIAALDYIETNLTEPFELSDIAHTCYCSLSGLHKIFGYVCGCTLSEYITKRRMSLAARELVNSGVTVTDVAFKYQYNSPESFTRAFQRIFNTPPSVYRSQHRFTEIYPRLIIELTNEKGGKEMAVVKKFVLENLYDALKELRGSYILCADTKNLMKINENYGHEAGDKILAETAKRVERCVGERLILRIGRDEFAVITEEYEKDAVLAMAKNILAMNRQDVSTGTVKIQLSLRIGIAKIPEGGLSYKEVLDRLDAALREAKKSESDYYIME